MKKKNNSFAEAIVGLFMVSLILLLAYFTIVVSGVEVFSDKRRQPLHLVFDNVGGLKCRDNVLFRGTKVGVVERIDVTASNLVVTAMVDDNVILRESATAHICNSSMLGGFYLRLDEGEGETVDLADIVIHGEKPTDWMEDIARISRNLNELTSSKELKTIVTNLAAMSVRARQICDKADLVVSRIERGEGTAGKLLSADDTVYRDISAAVADARSVIAKVNASSIVSNAEATVANARQISERINRDQTFADLEAGVAAFRKAAESFNIKETQEKANTLLANLNEVALKLKNGEGTLGRLNNDPKLYDEVNGLIRDVRQVIDNYRDTTPISTFSSLAVGAL